MAQARPLNRPFNIANAVKHDISAFAFLARKNNIEFGAFDVDEIPGRATVKVTTTFGPTTRIGAREDVIKGMNEVAHFVVVEEGDGRVTRLQAGPIHFVITWTP